MRPLPRQLRKLLLNLSLAALSFVSSVAVLELTFLALNCAKPAQPLWMRKHRYVAGPRDPFVPGAKGQPPSRSLATTISSLPLRQENPPPYEFHDLKETDRSQQWPRELLSGMKWPLFAANAASRSRVTVARSGETVFDTSLGTDDHGRRLTVQPDSRPRKDFAAIFGCSFVFGLGVNDEETLPSQIAKNSPALNVYNYGVPGAGPMEALELLRDGDFQAGVSGRPGHGLYIALYDHFSRVRPSITYIETKKNLPYYEEDSTGKIVRRESYSASHPWRTRFFELLMHSQTLRYLGIDFPFIIGDQDAKFMAKLLREIARQWEIKFHNRNFAVVLWPEFGEKAESLKHYLDAEGVSYLDYSTIPLGNSIRGSPIVSEYEGHPSAEVHQLLGRQISLDLGWNRN